jgi:hypothetical protein
MAAIGVCSAKAALFQWMKATPGKRLQPEANRSVMDVLKTLKPSGTTYARVLVHSTSVDEKDVCKVRNPMARYGHDP